VKTEGLRTNEAAKGQKMTATSKRMLAGLLAIAIFASLIPAGHVALAQERMVFAGWGGSIQAAQRKIYFDAFEKETGIKVIDVPDVSIIVGSVTAVLSVILGTATAYGLARSTWKGKALLQALILSPLLIPVIVIAVATYSVFSLVGLNGTFAGLIIGHTVITFPYTVVVISAALERFDPRFEQMAISLGATPMNAFISVTFPVIRAGIIVALLFAFLNSFDEVVMATFIAGPETTTLPKRIWDGIRFELSPVIAAVSSILVLLSCVVIGIAEVFNRRSRHVTGFRPQEPSELE
jgi:putative spermidine/putrescine transport system permease protein